MSRSVYFRYPRGPARLLGAGLLLLACACAPVWTAPERQAREFIQAEVQAPADLARLRTIANLPAESDPGALFDDLAARVGMEFLRARHAQGAPMKFVADEIRQIEAPRRAVTVRVTYLDPGSPAGGEVRFQVQLAPAGDDAWRIARILGEN